MNLVKELEDVLKQPNFMGGLDKVGVCLAVNQILDNDQISDSIKIATLKSLVKICVFSYFSPKFSI